MKHPKLGMHYQDCATRCKRIIRNPGHPEAKTALVNSLRNQCRLNEGERAQAELDKELSHAHKSLSTFSGAGNKQTGFGPGKKLGDGRHRYIDGEWVKV